MLYYMTTVGGRRRQKLEVARSSESRMSRRSGYSLWKDDLMRTTRTRDGPRSRSSFKSRP